MMYAVSMSLPSLDNRASGGLRLLPQLSLLSSFPLKCRMHACPLLLRRRVHLAVVITSVMRSQEPRLMAWAQGRAMWLFKLSHGRINKLPTAAQVAGLPRRRLPQPLW